jgi:hypothetical protein
MRKVKEVLRLRFGVGLQQNQIARRCRFWLGSRFAIPNQRARARDPLVREASTSQESRSFCRLSCGGDLSLKSRARANLCWLLA